MKRLGLLAHHEYNRSALIKWMRDHVNELQQVELYTSTDIISKYHKEAKKDAQKVQLIDSVDHKFTDSYGKVVHQGIVTLDDQGEGADQAMGTLLIDKFLDGVIYYVNPHQASNYEDDTKALMRQVNIHDRIAACNSPTANHIISSSKITGKDSEYRFTEPVGIALVAHEGKKDELIHWVHKNREKLEGHELYATGTTGEAIEHGLKNIKVTKFKSGPKGGDQQIAALVNSKDIQYAFFFSNPMWSQPHHVDVTAFTRVCIGHDVTLATNARTANYIVNSPMYGRRH